MKLKVMILFHLISIVILHFSPQLFAQTLMTNTEFEIKWKTTIGVTNQLQYCTDLSSNVWIDFGSPVVGDGATNNTVDFFQNSSVKYYRILTTTNTLPISIAGTWLSDDESITMILMHENDIVTGSWVSPNYTGNIIGAIDGEYLFFNVTPYTQEIPFQAYALISSSSLKVTFRSRRAIFKRQTDI